MFGQSLVIFVGGIKEEDRSGEGEAGSEKQTLVIQDICRSQQMGRGGNVREDTETNGRARGTFRSRVSRSMSRRQDQGGGWQRTYSRCPLQKH